MPGNKFQLRLFPGAVQRQVGDVVEKWMIGVTAKAERYSKERTPVDTGRLRSSISGRVERNANQVQGVIGTNVEYAPPVEFGANGRAPVGMLRGGAEQAVQEET